MAPVHLGFGGSLQGGVHQQSQQQPQPGGSTGSHPAAVISVQPARDNGNTGNAAVAGLAEPPLHLGAPVRSGSMNSDADSITSETGERKQLHMASILDFELVEQIGKGGFSIVIKALHIRRNRLYAMKVVSKRHLVEKKMVASSYRELEALKMSRHHPFIVCLHYAFQTDENLHFVLDLCEGGDLSQHLKLHRRFDERTVAFYGSEMVLALQHLHHHNIIYRDLKLSNILLDAQGHAVLSDFGLVKVGHSSREDDEDLDADTFCGTHGYMAPEIYTEASYTRVVDWWSLGAVLMLCLVGTKFGRPVLRKMSVSQGGLELPSGLSAEAVDLLQCLLDPEPERRLGTAEEVMRHAFFRDVDWEATLRRQVPPPMLPSLNKAADTQPENAHEPGQAVHIELPHEAVTSDLRRMENFDYASDLSARSAHPSQRPRTGPPCVATAGMLDSPSVLVQHHMGAVPHNPNHPQRPQQPQQQQQQHPAPPPSSGLDRAWESAGGGSAAPAPAPAAEAAAAAAAAGVVTGAGASLLHRASLPVKVLGGILQGGVDYTAGLLGAHVLGHNGSTAGTGTTNSHAGAGSDYRAEAQGSLKPHSPVRRGWDEWMEVDEEHEQKQRDSGDWGHMEVEEGPAHAEELQFDAARAGVNRRKSLPPAL